MLIKVIITIIMVMHHWQKLFKIVAYQVKVTTLLRLYDKIIAKIVVENIIIEINEKSQELSVVIVQ